MMLWLLAGCGTNWFGAWDFERFELVSEDGAAELVHGDAGWIECDDQGECLLLRRYDLDMQTLEPIPRERVTVEYTTAEDEEVVWGWGEAVQLQLTVSESTQTWILLEGTGVVLQQSAWQYVDARLELAR